MENQYNINDIIKTWKACRTQRLELEALAKKIKNGPEAQAKADILMYIDAQQVNGFKSDQGTVSRTSKKHIEIQDTEAACLYMYKQMTLALQAGRPLTDVLIFQKTAHKGAVTDIIKDKLNIEDHQNVTDEEFNVVANELGMRIVSTVDISFSK